MNSETNHYLKLLFENPSQSWRVIALRKIRSRILYFKQHFGGYGLLIILSYTIFSYIESHSFKKALTGGVVLPVVTILMLIVFLTIADDFTETLYRKITHKSSDGKIRHIIYFSALPLVAAAPFYPVPYAGKLILLTTLSYSLFLVYNGITRFLWLNASNRRLVFMISTLLTHASLAVVTALIMYLIKKFV